ncbi:hypothetical protein E4P82_18635 [Candidatus Competibacter phosphatis]|uniref:Uncharacterized protein n=1 Tax=Candidatus Competibacter phosphatis TaxID=221280 RepID=A0ABX1TSS6_9GAMM|nr:hypothetical protein [Candidatus Competibacter phosphatis]NMQ21029.1 hypothetical protein [Candidatus Competibacter phosphatis]
MATPASEIQHRQAGLSRGKALERGPAQPIGGPPVVPARYPGCKATQLKRSGGVPLDGGPANPIQGGVFVGRDVGPSDVTQPQAQLSRRIARGGPPV